MSVDATGPVAGTLPHRPPPLGSLGRELATVHGRPLAIAVTLAAIVGFAGPLQFLNTVTGVQTGEINFTVSTWVAAAVALAALTAGALIAAILPPLLLFPRDRAAAAAHAWIGAREVRRLLGSASAARGIPTTPAEANEWLATNPDVPRTRTLRVDLLVLAGRFDEARRVADHLPRRTPLEAYRHAEATALIDEQSGHAVDLTALRSAALRIPAGAERSEGRASLAVFEARRLIGRGDWRAPLVAVRREIPGSDVSILVRDFGVPMFQIIARWIVVPVATLIVGMAVIVTAMRLA